MVMTPVNDTPVIPNPPTVSCDAVQAAAVPTTFASVVVVVGRVVVDALVDDVDDVGGGEVELVQAASIVARATIAIMPTLRTMFVPPTGSAT